MVRQLTETMMMIGGRVMNKNKKDSVYYMQKEYTTRLGKKAIIKFVKDCPGIGCVYSPKTRYRGNYLRRYASSYDLYNNALVWCGSVNSLSLAIELLATKK
jgi:hypothetical protein